MLQGKLQDAMDLKLFIMKKYDFYAWGTTDILKPQLLQHVDAIASKAIARKGV